MTGIATLGASDDRTAIVEPGVGSLTYAELDTLASRVAGRLVGAGVGQGARVGLCMSRSADFVVAVLGTLRAGAAYVPLDPGAPPERNATILADCGVVTTLVDGKSVASLSAVAPQRSLEIIDAGAPLGLGRAIGAWSAGAEPASIDTPADALASVMYTSGSTGRPKGAMMTRRGIEVFAAWIHETLAPTGRDTFATHAHFHFAMSTFDIFGSLGSGAALVIVPEHARTSAERVASVIESERVSIWFSGPAILTQLARAGQGARLASLRVLAFAGEVFPIAHLRALRSQLTGPRYIHVWGSTETNVGACHELPSTDIELDAPPPIGRVCAHFEHRVVDESGRPVAAGETGELILRGPAVYAGYLNQPELTEEKRFPDPGGPWHRTGDLVMELASGELRYCGRLGRMLKLRGYRIEPGEIEARLYEHASIVEAGVVGDGPEDARELVAHLRTVDNAKLSMVELKQFCAVKLPPYMIPNRFVFHDALPRNANGKIDLQRLAGAR